MNLFYDRSSDTTQQLHKSTCDDDDDDNLYHFDFANLFKTFQRRCSVVC